MSSSEHLRDSFFARLRNSSITCDGACPGALSMRRDQALAEMLVSDPTNQSVFVRFYCWQPWCISLGNTQPESDIAHEHAHADGIDVVRRPTGGRAILHARELTYALVLRMDAGLTHGAIYHFWHQWLAETLATHFGIPDLTFARTQPDFPFLYRHQPTRWLCFASSARYEVVWRGRKLIGSAQRLYGDVLLQHGSLLLGSGHERLPFYVRDCPDPASVATYLAQRSVALDEICGRSVSFDELSSMLIAALRTATAPRSASDRVEPEVTP